MFPSPRSPASRFLTTVGAQETVRPCSSGHRAAGRRKEFLFFQARTCGVSDVNGQGCRERESCLLYTSPSPRDRG
eukprot:758024-Rhodomonas_salina.1